MEFDADIVIVGGGLVGQSLCCALEGVPLRILQIEAEPPRPLAAPRWDERNFALARRSTLALGRWGVWQHVEPVAHPILHVHASSRGDFGAVRVHASDYGVPALGYTAPARAVGAALAARLADCRTVERRAPAELRGLRAAADGVELDVFEGGSERCLRARLVVGADGTASAVRGFAGIEVQTHDYGQTAIVCSVEARDAPSGWAFERFTDSGPFALLPLGNQRLGMIWAVDSACADAILALDDAQFVHAAQERFGRRAGVLSRVGTRQPWPLRLTRANDVVGSRVVLLGNAAQTIHPVGAQGFNLGLRDVAALADGLLGAVRDGADCGAPQMLAAYAAARAPDREATIRMSDGLARAFSHRALPLRILRGAAMTVLDRLPVARQHLAYSMMGWHGHAEPA